MIIVGVYCNVFIVLPIRVKTCRCNVFSFFTRLKCARPKNRARVRSFARPSVSDRHRVRNLSKPDCVFEIKMLQNVDDVILVFLLLTLSTLRTLAYNAAQNNSKIFNINNFSCVK